MTRRPKLYPNHQHHWIGVHARDCALNTPPPRCDCTPQAQCTVCDLEMPRNVVEAYDRIGSCCRWHNRNCEPPGDLCCDKCTEFCHGLHRHDTGGLCTSHHGDRSKCVLNLPDTRCTHQDAAGQCLDHQGHQGEHQPPTPPLSVSEG